ncbi:hypothetical protein BASA60_011199 [Batrachochytrium salamandrivorans]|nr:hypothetical protein BASA60_011199 [Batrachochytrium salamandrivorans]
MRLSAITLSMYLIGTVSVSSYPTGGSEPESESCNNGLGHQATGECDHSSGKVEDPRGGSLKPEEPAQDPFKPFSFYDGNGPKPLEDPQPEEQNNETKGSKGDSPEPKEFTQDPSTWYTDSENDRPKPLEDPPTQEQNKEVIKPPKKGFSPDSSGPTSLYMSISAESHQTRDNRGSALGRIKGGSVKSKEPAQDPFKSFSAYYSNEPKEPQDFRTQEQSGDLHLAGSNSKLPKKTHSNLKKPAHNPYESLSVSNIYNLKPPQDLSTQEQNNEAITAPKVGSNHDSSSFTGAVTGSGGAANTDDHLEEESQGSALGQTKEEDDPIPDSSALEDIDMDLPGELIDPQEDERPTFVPTPNPNPTPLKKTPKLTSVHGFLALHNSKMPLSHRQGQALELFSLLNKPERLEGTKNEYTLERISWPEKEKTEQENMMAYFKSTYDIKKKNQNLMECERKIFSFPTPGPSLASKYFEAKKSQTKTIEKRALTDEEEGEYLIYLCLTIRGEFLSAQFQSKQAWSKLTDEQMEFYQYLGPMVKNMIFQFKEPTTASQ